MAGIRNTDQTSINDDGNPDVPIPVAEALRAAHRADLNAHPGDRATLDAAILGMARREIGRRRTSSWVLWRVGGGLAAAASLSFAAWALWPISRGPSMPTSGIATFDISKPGGVTILDAFALARLLERGGGQPSVTWDLTGDGAIDQRDVDAIARQAVRLSTTTDATRGGPA